MMRPTVWALCMWPGTAVVGDVSRVAAEPRAYEGVEAAPRQSEPSARTPDEATKAPVGVGKVQEAARVTGKAGAAAGPVSSGSTSAIPAPRVPRQGPALRLGVGLSPEAVGRRDELDLIAQLERTLRGSKRVATVRRVRPGAQAREVCREREDDVVVQVGYVADVTVPVVLAYDCALDRALSVRSTRAAAEPGLAAALGDEHQALIAQGAKARVPLFRDRPRARRVAIAAAALVVVAGAIGLLLANALRDEVVVIKVAP